MANDGKVIIQIDGDDTNFKQTINNVGVSLSSLKSLITKLGLSALVTKGIKEAVTNTNKLQDSIAKASTLFGSVNVDVENLNKKLKELSSATGVSADQIGNSLYNALSAGIPATEDMSESLAFMEANLKLAKAGFTDIDNAVQATAKVINAYGMDIDEIDQVHRVLMETQNLGITTVDQLGQALATVTPIASNFGLSFEEVGASLAVMTKAGTDTNTATTQLRAILNALGQQSSSTAMILKEETGKSFQELIQDGMTLQEIIGVLNEKAEESGQTLADMFGEVRAGTGAMQLASDSTQTYIRFLEDMKQDADIVGEAYEKVMASRSEQWNLLASRLKNIAINITMSSEAESLLDKVFDISESIVEDFENFSKMLPNILANIPEAISILFTSISEAFVGIFSWDNIKTTLMNTIETISSVFPILFDYIGKQAFAMFKQMSEDFSNTKLGKWLDSGDKSGTTRGTDMSNAFAQLYSYQNGTEFTPEANMLEDFTSEELYQQAQESLSSALTELFNGASQTASSSKNILITAFEGVSNAIKDAFLPESDVEELKEKVEQVAEDIVPEVPEGEIESSLSFWDKLKNTIDDFTASLEENEASWGDVFTSLASNFSSLLDAMTDYSTQYYENQAEQLQNELDTRKEAGDLTLSEELDLQNKIDDQKRKAFEAEKRNSVMQALINGALAITQAFAQLGPIAGAVASALIATTTAVQIATINQQQYQGYEEGGLVGGSGITGDKHQIWANAGELILTRAQQRSIADQLESKTSSPVISVEFSGNIFGDDRTIAEYVYDAIKTAQYNGEVAKW